MKIILSEKQLGYLYENINEITLPPGFDSSDIKPIDSLFDEKQMSDIEEDQLGNVDVRPDIEVDKLLKKVSKGDKPGKSDPLLHSSTVEGIKDESGNEIDVEKLKSILSKRPSKILGETNEKLMKSGVATITLPKYRGLIHDEKSGELKIVNTCPHAHKCIIGCYAGKGFYVMYKNSSERSAQLLTYLFNDYDGWKKQLIGEINSLVEMMENAGKRTVIRWHDSGDFFSPDYLDIAIDVAKSTPYALHYAYTKEVSMVKSKKLPKNFLTRFSFGGTEDKLINKEKDLYSDIIMNKPKDGKIFKDQVYIDFKKYYDREKDKDGNTLWRIKKDYTTKDGKPADALMEFKKEISQGYGLNVNTILSFQELMRLPEGNKPKWNVIVAPSNADNAAFRRDVRGVYLIYH
jgi:hypothetical protein